MYRSLRVKACRIHCASLALCMPRRGAASATWFGGTSSSDSLMGTVKGLVGCLCGIGLVNLWCRGNLLGQVETESDVCIPLATLRAHVPEPTNDGFVDGSSDSERR
ncbi:hypothetical protein DQ04_00581070 [Trypanosoma grayi]|uniref:hypothetical protein n=1 Tax=Trypanosoma grayi TaxID=71804 RepID=UPI0004F3FC5E|nr:hypothetical protein DQ04_00581070 [Trypanosoma grayi]KEG14189.1 hypothetical protein DQ04_00581070 [Trypanosoma grayi]